MTSTSENTSENAAEQTSENARPTAPSGETEENATDQSFADRGENRTRSPQSKAFQQFMASQWAEPQDAELPREAVADHAARRRRRVSESFPGERIVVPAGAPKVRSNDTDYRFRPHSAFAHLTGLGVDHEPSAVLVLEPTDDGQGDDGSSHTATLYFHPMAGRDTQEFYADSRNGQFWVGDRPTLREISSAYGLRTADLSQLEPALTKNVGDPAQGGVRVRALKTHDARVDQLVDSSRLDADLDLEAADREDSALVEALSELRLVKDEHEVGQLRESVAMTIRGFEDVVRSLGAATGRPRGERVVEGAFFARARSEGNDLGYDTIAASGNNATVLHWIRNTGVVTEGDLILVDAGVEAESLYTADITRTLPVNGIYSPVQRKIYQAVLDAADRAFEVAVPGNRFRDVHDAAMEVLATRLEEWGLLPVSAEVSLSVEGQHHRRWMPHGTSHHLGLDVHDCAQARREMYQDAVIEPGMVFTIEPGLYFKDEDLAVPAEYRGIGVRIEDDVLITEDGNENLSAALPRDPDEVEAWMAGLTQG
ncbi:aminopeptidase P family protein [Kocuria sp. JC486]|uniref:Xaa-Pro aminopeptidase n=1 Tax=Kocuria soli TaxID=2485125 RepID=A0A3N3ZNZ0_9MICC|nr:MULTISPECIES: aminopeptidase P family protein [Kocuria]NHU85530.1 aminopeptidase P family protein [Kocuria sp. JC486]ROZ62651.1 aminopeptidase P family protein [Kocuria soli]